MKGSSWTQHVTAAYGLQQEQEAEPKLQVFTGHEGCRQNLHQNEASKFRTPFASPTAVLRLNIDIWPGTMIKHHGTGIVL